MQVRVQTPGGQTKQAQIRLAAREGPDFTLGEFIAFLTPILGVPLLSLIVGYWVVAVRPRDLNAWLVFLLLAFPETGFGNLDWSFWPMPWYIIFGLWNVIVPSFVFVALLWFGIYFPERRRMDRRWPWLKWLALAATLCVVAIELRLTEAQRFDARSMPSLVPVDLWTDRVNGCYRQFALSSS